MIIKTSKKAQAILLTIVSLISYICPAVAQFSIKQNEKTGSLTEIINPMDRYKMNWIFSSGDSVLKWQPKNEDWGMGSYDISDLGISNERWNQASRIVGKGSNWINTYQTKALDVIVRRASVEKDYVETYTFKNITGKKIVVTGLKIYTPFNDSYPDALTSATNRCNAHIWPGMNSSYVNAIRMNGVGPHLGLVLLEGAIATYSINNRGLPSNVPWQYSGSNVRGTIVMNFAPFTILPGSNYTIKWKLFWHNGWKDFYSKAIANGFVKLQASRYVLNKDSYSTIHVNANNASGVKTRLIKIKGEHLGEHSFRLYYAGGQKFTYLNYLVISTPENRINNRVNFIVDHQQMNDAADPRNGAYMVYDNDLKKIYDKPVHTVSNADRDEGRERIGMGVLVAKWLQEHKSKKVYNSLMRYVRFVREKLQTPDYKLYSNVSHTSSPRGYNYPWVSHLYLETYKLSNDKQYLIDFYRTLMKYFEENGFQHYSIDFRVADGLFTLKKEGMKTQYDSLLSAFTKAGDAFVKAGINYPKHEVNYEQSIVAPAVSFLCEMYQVTKKQKYLDAAKLQLRSLEAFSGFQPDVHLYEISIRHWDGYWFGKNPTWGDVMPHYWSTLTAVAYHQYFRCTGDRSYQERAKIIVANNLLNFEEDGTAHCAYLYPATIDNKPGKFYDQFANDQDWALVFYHEVLYQ
jgi:hypothetical protein